MTAPPLRLKHYFFPEISVTANANFHYEDFKNGVEFTVQTKVALAASEKKPDVYQLALELKLEALDERPLPYDVSLSVVGFFAVDNGVDPGRRDELVRINGASMLYSAAREFLLTVTGRGPWQPLMLPTVSFVETGGEKPGKKGDAKAAKGGKGKAREAVGGKGKRK